MPYDPETRTIATKVRGVASQNTPRQAVLREMFQRPEDLRLIYLMGKDLFVNIDGRDVHMGELKPSYVRQIANNETHITSWQVTGCKPVKTGQTSMLGEVVTFSKVTGRFGLNVTIQIK